MDNDLDKNSTNALAPNCFMSVARVVEGKYGNRLEWLDDAAMRSTPVGTMLCAVRAAGANPGDPQSPEAGDSDGLPPLPAPQVLGYDRDNNPIIGYSAQDVSQMRREAVAADRRSRVRKMSLPPAMHAALAAASLDSSKSDAQVASTGGTDPDQLSIANSRTFATLWHACFVAAPGRERLPMQALLNFLDQWGAQQRDIGRSQYEAEVKRFWRVPEDAARPGIPAHLREFIEALAHGFVYLDKLDDRICAVCDCNLSAEQPHDADCLVAKASLLLQSEDAGSLGQG